MVIILIIIKVQQFQMQDLPKSCQPSQTQLVYPQFHSLSIKCQFLKYPVSLINQVFLIYVDFSFLLLHLKVEVEQFHHQTHLESRSKEVVMAHILIQLKSQTIQVLMKLLHQVSIEPIIELLFVLQLEYFQTMALDHPYFYRVSVGLRLHLTLQIEHNYEHLKFSQFLPS